MDYLAPSIVTRVQQRHAGDLARLGFAQQLGTVGRDEAAALDRQDVEFRRAACTRACLITLARFCRRDQFGVEGDKIFWMWCYQVIEETILTASALAVAARRPGLLRS